MHTQNTKYTQKTKSRFGHFLRPLARKWNEPILKDIDNEVNK